MKEYIHFPEERILDITRVIRRGLEGEEDPELIAGLLSQCEELEAYIMDDGEGEDAT